MADEQRNDEIQDETAATGQEPQTTDAPEGVADVENLPEEAPAGDSAELETPTPESPDAVAEEPGLDEPPGGEPATEEPAEAPKTVGEGPAAVDDDEPEEEPQEQPQSAEEPVEGPADEPAPEEAAPEAESTQEPAEGSDDAAPAEAAAPALAEPKKKRKRLPRSLRRARSKATRERPAERKPITRLPKPEYDRGRRQERQGTVVSAAADKTIVVRVDVVKVHPMYKKVVKRSTRLHAHDEENQAKVGDVVRVVETRPLSKLKRWRLQEVVEAAK